MKHEEMQANTIIGFDTGSKDESCVTIGFKRNGVLHIAAELRGEDAADFLRDMQDFMRMANSHYPILEALKKARIIIETIDKEFNGIGKALIEEIDHAISLGENDAK